MIISSEQVSVGHSDKLCDQIKDNQVVVAGEVLTKPFLLWKQ